MPSEPTQKDWDAVDAMLSSGGHMLHAITFGTGPTIDLRQSIAQALATARAEGFAEGMERAAEICGDSEGNCDEGCRTRVLRAAAKGETK